MWSLSLGPKLSTVQRVQRWKCTGEKQPTCTDARAATKCLILWKMRYIYTWSLSNDWAMWSWRLIGTAFRIIWSEIRRVDKSQQQEVLVEGQNQFLAYRFVEQQQLHSDPRHWTCAALAVLTDRTTCMQSNTVMTRDVFVLMCISSYRDLLHSESSFCPFVTTDSTGKHTAHTQTQKNKKQKKKNSLLQEVPPQ